MSTPHKYSMALVGSTHGDEPLGHYVFTQYPMGESEFFRYASMIANPEALSLHVRGVEGDLNRSYPGDPHGNYEERRAAQILPIVQKYDIVLDIHQAFAHMPDILIVKEWNETIADIAQYFATPHVVEFSKGQGSYSGLMLSYIENGIALEYGYAYQYSEACERITADLDNLFYRQQTYPDKSHYRIVGDISLEYRGTTELQNLVEITAEQKDVLDLEGDNLFPIFIDGYDDKWAVVLEKISE